MIFEVWNIFITFAMRKIYRSEAFDDFYDSLPANVKEKVSYLLYLMSEVRVINSKFIKKLIGTDFYELRISLKNEYRVIVFAVDDSNFIQAKQIILLNGFMKKSTKDYKREIEKAETLMARYYEKKD